jgi:hypothetical protein
MFDITIASIDPVLVKDLSPSFKDKITPEVLLHLWGRVEEIGNCRLVLALSKLFLKSKKLTFEKKLSFLQEATRLYNREALTELDPELKTLERKLIDKLKIKYNLENAPDEWVKEIFHSKEWILDIS